MKSIGRKYSEILMNIVVSVTSILELMPSDFMDSSDGSRKWKRKEIIGHLIDSAYNNHRRIIQAMHTDHLMVDGYDQELWVSSNNYQHRSASEILDTFYYVQQQLSHLLLGLEDSLITKEYAEHNFHPVSMEVFPEYMSLSHLIYDYIYHLEHHIKQIVKDYISVLPPEYYK